MDAPSEDARATLECTSQPGVVLRINAGNVIGREGDVDLTELDDAKYLSRKHARFTERLGKWYVENLSTKSFTYVNGKSVEANTEQAIEPGDKLTFGIIRCTFKQG